MSRLRAGLFFLSRFTYQTVLKRPPRTHGPLRKYVASNQHVPFPSHIRHFGAMRNGSSSTAHSSLARPSARARGAIMEETLPRFGVSLQFRRPFHLLEEDVASTEDQPEGIVGLGSPPAKNAESPTPIVGFVGLGNMGSHMAANILRAGHPLVVHDRNSEAMEALVEGGALTGGSAADVAEQSDVVITMLPSAPHVLEVYLGKGGLLSNKTSMRPFLFIDASTVDPATCRAVATAATVCKRTVQQPAEGAPAEPATPFIVDAPVSGGVPGAKAGTLTFMVGGTKESFHAASLVLSAMGSRTVHCGPSGAGAAAKLCNNLALAVEMAAVAEAMALGQKLGLNSHLLAQIFNASTARSWSSDAYNPVPGVMDGVPSERGYQGGFSNRLMMKDLQLVIDAASAIEQEKGAIAPMAKQVLSIYAKLCQEGKDGLDFSSIYEHFYNGGPANSLTT
eukprot:TRINITY_DN5477_c0_g2_i1.p1 TRINITY_DN5477_c0_g2~~TRINITY_DN5477_c0_g2_i1.p1  ORF type:complete len:450 (+),score=50.64 TRINITY_DN5477_c0_g2_i1:242-1591(+)